jgi:hypothetical protein
MSWTNSRVTNWMDKYFEARPQLRKPQRGILGYEVDPAINPVLNSMMNEICKNKTMEEDHEGIS